MLGGSQNTGGTVEAVHPVFNSTLPQALPEASSGVSPSHYQATATANLLSSSQGCGLSGSAALPASVIECPIASLAVVIMANL
jgi:hypothetical protein